MRRFWLLGVALPAMAQTPALFESKIKPVLVERCAKCHSGAAAFSRFDLTTRASLLKGGGQGVDVVPGDAAGSRLYQWVKAGRMPPDRALDAGDVEAFRQWIQDGALWSG
ncbi:MAG: hypothetical protein HYR60_30905, partial [Acidobacteria bacterium]|nr:hypothetical protein [Acidobacteriota bacterium]